MGNFSKYIRKLTIQPIGLKVVSIENVKAQYNPYRFEHWESLHEGPPEKVLSIEYSPHVRLLKMYDEYPDIWKQISQTAYYKLQKKYGRGHKWIEKKIRGFLNMYAELKVFPVLRSNISVMKTPIKKNPHNDGLEVFEGHHRIACLCNIGIQDITVILLGHHSLR